MKRNILLAFFFIICTVTLNAQWHFVGNRYISFSYTSWTSVAIDANGTPYVCYHDDSGNDKFLVKKFNGSSWATVGAASWIAGNTQLTNICMSIAENGLTPYVIGFDNTYYGSVQKFDGSHWVTVGNAMFTGYRPQDLRMTVARDGTPYVVFSEYDSMVRISVMKYDGQGWQYVGGRYQSTDWAQYDAIACDSASTPYIAFSDWSAGQSATVMKFDGIGWVALGGHGCTPGAVSFTSIAIDHNGVPYLAFTDNNFGLNVMKYTNSTWTYVGNTNFATPGVNHYSLAFDPNNVPYIGFQNQTTEDANVMKLQGNNWINVGDSNFTGHRANYLSFALSPAGVPYVSFLDYNLQTATVMEYGSAASVADISTDAEVRIYPDPSTSQITVALSTSAGDIATLRVTDMMGQSIYDYDESSQMANSLSIDTRAWPQGLYLISGECKNGRFTRKVVKE